jgi:hypothetical protein
MVTLSAATCSAEYEGTIALVAVTQNGVSFNVRDDGLHTFTVGKDGNLVGYCFNGCSSNQYLPESIPPKAVSLYERIKPSIPSVDSIRQCALSGLYRHWESVLNSNVSVYARVVDVIGREEQGFQAMHRGNFVQATPASLTFLAGRDNWRFADRGFPTVSVLAEGDSFVVAFYNLLRSIP